MVMLDKVDAGGVLGARATVRWSLSYADCKVFFIWFIGLHAIWAGIRARTHPYNQSYESKKRNGYK